MTTTILIITAIALAVAGLFLPVLWIAAVVLLVAAGLYAWQTAFHSREGA